MGSTDTVAVVTTRKGETPADQAQQSDEYCRNTDVCVHPGPKRQKGANQYARWANCTRCHQRLVTEKRDYWKEARLLRARKMEDQQDDNAEVRPHTRTDGRL